MIAAGSLVGFALGFVLLAWAISALAAAVMGRARHRLTSAGPAAERAAAALALTQPPLLAAIAVVAIAVAQRGADHCAVHSHHLHLCIQHGGAWAGRLVPVMFVAGVATALILRAGRAVSRWRQTRRALLGLRRAGQVRRVNGVEVVLAPSVSRLSLTAGAITPTVFLSTAVWDALDEGERTAVLAHETAHAHGRDVLRGLLLAAAASLGAPRLADRILVQWRSATERLRDRDAARACGDPALVGAALLKVARLPPARPLALAVGISAEADLSSRIDALLADGPAGREAARRLGIAACTALVLVLASSVAWSEPLHHALETLLALL